MEFHFLGFLGISLPFGLTFRFFLFDLMLSKPWDIW